MGTRVDQKDFENFAMNKRSYAESRQDLFALYVLGAKTGGYFVDFGAGDGVTGSNSYLLEKNYQWRGIVCEPCRYRHATLTSARKCSIDFDCVYTSTGKTIQFLEAEDKNLSTITTYVGSDSWKEKRLAGASTYPVTTISLNDLLDKHQAPSHIDYLSMDTEGSEFHILCNYDFSRSISVLTIEHNNNAYRQGIFDLMRQRGYKRVLESICPWDDWYVHQTLLE